MCILAYQSSQDGWIEAKEYNFAQDLLPLWVASIKIFEIEDLIWWSLSFQRASSNCVKNFASLLISSLLLWLCTLMIVDSLEALIFDYGGFWEFLLLCGSWFLRYTLNTSTIHLERLPCSDTTVVKLRLRPISQSRLELINHMKFILNTITMNQLWISRQRDNQITTKSLTHDTALGTNHPPQSYDWVFAIHLFIIEKNMHTRHEKDWWEEKHKA